MGHYAGVGPRKSSDPPSDCEVGKEIHIDAGFGEVLKVKKEPNKYQRAIKSIDGSEQIFVDVYSVLEAFNVTCPARQHAIKKLLCAGLRGKGDASQDLRESIQAIERAVTMEKHKGEALVEMEITNPKALEAIARSTIDG